MRLSDLERNINSDKIEIKSKIYTEKPNNSNRAQELDDKVTFIIRECPMAPFFLHHKHILYYTSIDSIFFGNIS